MVLVVVQIRSRDKISKPWLGIQVPGTTTIQSLYNDFAAELLDATSQIPNEYNSTKISATLGMLNGKY